MITSCKGTLCSFARILFTLILHFFLIVCSTGGLILDYAVAKYHGIAVFSPVMNGMFPI